MTLWKLVKIFKFFKFSNFPYYKTKKTETQNDQLNLNELGLTIGPGIIIPWKMV